MVLCDDEGVECGSWNPTTTPQIPALSLVSRGALPRLSAITFSSVKWEER